MDAMLENCPARCGLTAGCRFCNLGHTIPMGLVAVPNPPVVNLITNEANREELAELKAQLAIVRGERDELAGRLDLLWRQRASLLKLLRSIKRNGGCGERHWRFINRVLQGARRASQQVVVNQADKIPSRGQ